MAKTKKRARKRYTDVEKAKIIEAANKEKLTAAAVEKRFGVKPVTYYSWRKAGKATRKGLGAVQTNGRRGRPARADSIAGAVRDEVQKRVRDILPAIVREETNRYLNEVLGK